MERKSLVVFIAFSLVALTGYAQLGVGTTSPNKSAQLEVKSSDKGLLIPQVALTSITDTTTITEGNVDGLTVFNTSTVTGLTPGYYYWSVSNSKWHRLLNEEDIASLTDNQELLLTNENLEITNGNTIDLTGNVTLPMLQAATAANSGIFWDGTKWDHSNRVATVNNQGPDAGGNITLTVGTVYTAGSANVSDPNFNTNVIGGTPNEGDIYIVNEDTPNASDVGKTYAYDSATTAWKEITPAAAAYSATYLKLDGTNSMTGDLDMGAKRIKDLANPTLATDGATKAYVDQFTVSTPTPTATAQHTVATIAESDGTTHDIEETVTSLVQDVATGVLTYTPESGTPQTALVRSADANNVLTAGTDGGAYLDPTKIITNTTLAVDVSDLKLTDSRTGVPNSVTVPLADINIETGFSQSLTTGVLTYTPESGAVNAKTANVVSANVNNVLTVGTDGGAYLDPTEIITNSTLVVDGSDLKLTDSRTGVPNSVAVPLTAINLNTSLSQDTGTGVVTYTPESGSSQTANIRSAEPDNLLKIGANGGVYLTQGDITPVTNTTLAVDVSDLKLTDSRTGVPNSVAVPLTAINLNTSLSQDTGTGVVTYTPESGSSQTANIRSAEPDNLLKIGANGGVYLTQGDITPVTNTTLAVDVSDLKLTDSRTGVPNSVAVPLTAINLNTSLSQDTGTGVVTYTPESGSSQTANVVSANANNVLAVGTDGGAYLDPAEIITNSTLVVDGSDLKLTDSRTGVPNSVAVPLTAINLNTSLSQDTGTGVVTYTPESGPSQTANVVSANLNNVLAVGTDGGAYLDPAEIITNSTLVVDGSDLKLTDSRTGVPNSVAVPLTAINLNTSLSQDTGTGVVTYTPESGSSQTANIKSAEPDNLLKIGANGGVYLTQGDITPVTNTTLAVDVSDLKLTDSRTGVPNSVAVPLTAINLNTSLSQDTGTGVVTYTPESGPSQTANVVSANANNVLTVGTDGGAYLDPAEIITNSTLTVVNNDTDLRLTDSRGGANFVEVPLTDINIETDFSQDAVTGVITYTPESGAANAKTANVVSTDSQNIILSGSDGGAFISQNTLEATIQEPWYSADDLQQATGTTPLGIYYPRKVGVGFGDTSAPNFATFKNGSDMLYVNGNAKVFGDVEAVAHTTPDYVFEKYYEGTSKLNESYQMKTLKEVEAFTRKHKHLPGVPSAREVAERGGILLNRSTEINLEKIEELYLHAIAQEKALEEKERKINTLEQRVQKLEKAIEVLLAGKGNEQ